jgi:ketosteroid isomerase-like protein
MKKTNEELARQEMEAALRGDLEAMLACYSEDVVLHYPGRNILSGVYTGKQAIRTWIEKLSHLVGPGGSFERTLHDILANDDHAIQLVSVQARTSAGRSAHWNAAVVMHAVEGKITEIWLHIDDPYAVDDLLS